MIRSTTGPSIAFDGSTLTICGDGVVQHFAVRDLDDDAVAALTAALDARMEIHSLDDLRRGEDVVVASLARFVWQGSVVCYMPGSRVEGANRPLISALLENGVRLIRATATTESEVAREELERTRGLVLAATGFAEGRNLKGWVR